jgi:hypothetical protein
VGVQHVAAVVDAFGSVTLGVEQIESAAAGIAAMGEARWAEQIRRRRIALGVDLAQRLVAVVVDEVVRLMHLRCLSQVDSVNL